jgi:citrate synthase
MPSKKYQITDPATGRQSELPVLSGTVGPDVVDISSLQKDQGVFTYDPGFMATAATSSAITYIDGDAGILLYRGYPIEQLAEQSSFLEVCYLLQKGELPSAGELAAFTNSISRHTMLNEWILRLYRGFHHDAHPMAMVATIVASLAAFYHDSTDISDDRHREIFSHRMIAKTPTIAAAAYKHALGQPFIYPRNDLGYTANMLHMFFAVPCEPYEVDELHARALDLLFILHADHEQNASTSTVRLAGSTGCNPYTAMSAGVSALWGPAHGGANEAVVDMLGKIGDAAHVPEFLAKVKDSKGGVRLMGFGHRVYKNFDPRATIIREMCQGPRQARPDRQPAVRARAQARGSGAQGRVFHQPQAVPERRLLLGDHLSRARHPARDVHRDVRDRPHRRLGRALAGDDLRPGDEDRAPAPALYGPGSARLRPGLQALGGDVHLESSR